MGWYGPEECGCGCFQCDTCDAVTYFTINIPDPVCPGTADPNPGFCSRNNGTYVFRTVGEAVIDACAWIVSPLGTGLCWDGLDITATYIGPSVHSSCPAVAMTATIRFENAPGGVRVSVELRYEYTTKNWLSGVVNSAIYIFTFSDVFETCADAIGATLPHTGTVVSVCDGTAPGDFCNVAGATITIG